ncbi:uncharacterized protein EI97DRAFT_211340 [Westerdykella ornata]|uniref:Uncharacterized protein n=1 Tax=Westerdykella ornata TaxID=318751 RepID=A0A6A6J9P1_WESOR|nr:uncharacterized protein EI97DRAFT_211340 [Westerdykella ornata]KAF2272346.1 hypothetical protein EI97DRAFT_211340 [Westerdykella ornata]
MANSRYSQPPYSQWFPPPGVPLTPPAAPPNQQSGLQHQFPSGLPGLNFQAYSQNMQQSHYAPWPAPPAPQLSPFPAVFPPPFPASAGFPIPPPPVPASTIPYAAPPAPSAPPHQTEAPRADASAWDPQSSMSLNDRVAAIADSDKEEGELSDADDASARARRVVELPRSVPETSINNFGSVAKSVGRGVMASSNTQNGYGRGLPNDLCTKREEAKRFVSILQENKIEYTQLTREGLDVELLRQLYDDLGLPIQAEPSAAELATVNPPTTPNLPVEPSSHLISSVPTEQGPGESVKPAPAITTNAPQILPVKATKSPADRQEYIARLQALKSTKQSNAGKTTPVLSSPVEEGHAPADPQSNTSRLPVSKAAQVTAPTTAVSLPSSSNAKDQPQVMKKVAGTSTPKSEAEKARQTELIKQRLEMMRAQGKLPPSNPPTPQGTDATGGNAPAKPSSTVPAALNAPIARDSSAAAAATLPGLFMNSPAFSKVGQPTGTAQVAAVPGIKSSARKRPVASDFDNEHRSPPHPGPPYTRPLGQSPHEHHHESMVIPISDTESDGSDMELDDDHTGAQPASQSIQPHAARNGIRTVLPNGGSSGKQSAVLTPPASRTPAEATSEEILKREQAILKLKAKIAALSSKKKTAQAKKDSLVALSAAESSGIETKSSHNGNATSHAEPSQLVGVAIAAPEQQAVVPDTVIPAVTGGANRSTEWTKQRRIEIQSALRTLDSDLEVDNTRLAQLEKQIAELRSKRDREKRDREKLLEELESFGIDTDGMADEELQARKAETGGEKEVQPAAQSRPSSSTLTEVVPVTEVVASGEVQGRSPQEAIRTPAESVSPGISPTSNVPGSLPLQADSRIKEDVAMDDAESTLGASPAVEITASQDHVSQGRVAPLTVEVATDQIEPATSIDEEDFYSPEPAVHPVTTPTMSTQHEFDSRSSAKSPSSEGEMEMSEAPEGEEEEYEPEQTMKAEAVATSANEVPKSMGPGVLPHATSTLPPTEDEGEVYEPALSPAPADDSSNGRLEARAGAADAVDGKTRDIHPPLDTSETTGQEAETDDHDGMDLSTSSDESDDPSTSRKKVHRGSISHTYGRGSDIAVADDLAPELQSQGLPALVHVEKPVCHPLLVVLG